MDTIDIAKVAHQANKAYCEALGDNSQPDWKEAPNWQVQSAINGVQFRQNNPDAPTSAQHEAWMAEKIADGWVYGPIKDPVAKIHPCIMPYDNMTKEQKLKDALVIAIIETLS